MTDCIFCRIAAGELPAEVVLDTPRVLAFLDIAPVHYGHTLIIPRDHYQTLLDLPGDLWQEMGRAAREVAQALQKSFYARGFNLGMNNFEAAGQVVFHAHLHVIPRYQNDGLLLFPQGTYPPGDLAKVGQRLREALEVSSKQ
jgi:histidine triad (HIT) family protein